MQDCCSELLEATREAKSFQADSAVVVALAAAVSFVMALALNEAFKRTFELIPIASGLLGLWIYAIVALILGVLLLWLLHAYLQPALHKLFYRKKKPPQG